MAREKQARRKSKSEQGERIVGEEVKKVNGRQECRRFGGFVGHCKDFGSYLVKIREPLEVFEQKSDFI